MGNSEGVGFRDAMAGTPMRHLLKKPRPLYVIAEEIWNDWPRPHFAVKPYLMAMQCLNSIGEKYYLDTGKSVVRYFLANTGTWRGPVAERVKLELKGML